ncbi:ESX secretion-associated protein EspG [Nocardia uniformis]|uniref:ESX secretion-associated protein EspG n=1 Tax=Nocardia uniformis TaxID=53432 RepID=A0A849C696_9NOCA|nr:ESX secretion-associated protein EspG [Nocardia uniformis]NNH71865.1 ESX secretion-associated protein EspG [Nocardia uniformis]
MRPTWTFTDLELVVGWEAMKENLLPRPFIFRSRTHWYEDFLREKRGVRERLEATMDSAAWAMLDVVARPDIRLIVRGLNGDVRAEPKGSIRMHAVRRGGSAYVLTQLPGQNADEGGDFTITECDPFALAEVVVAELPQAKPGRESNIQLPAVVDGEDHMVQGESMLWDSFDNPVGHAGERFAQASFTGVGGIEIAQGTSRFGPRGRVIRRLEWRDVVDDGRYLVVRDNPPVAHSVDVKRMVSLINNEIAVVVQAIKDERATL